MTDLEVKALHKSYGDQPVLRGLDFAVAAGSFTSILGPSGSGKTTLLRVIAGFERADRGVVRLGTEVVDDADRFVTPDRRRIGFVPQDGSLFPHISVEQNVGFGLPRRERRGRRVAELLDMVGLGGLERRYPHQLSGGQQQRVALARALAIEPSLVLLDEPFASLDASLRTALRRDVRRVLKEAGTTALLVTHDQDEALSLADRVAVLREGRIGQYDTPRELYARPSSPELALGLGETNFLRGKARGTRVETPLGLIPLEKRPATDLPPDEGTTMLVLIRAEQVLVAGEPGGDRPTARVLNAEFYGHDAVVRLCPDWDESMIIISRTSEAGTLPAEGTRVALSVRGSVIAWAEALPAGGAPGDSGDPNERSQARR
ncbi:MAG: ABC transporter ATP-binding protein [Acidimicrobiales bacterium]